MSPKSNLKSGDLLPDTDDVSRYCKPNDYDRRLREPKLAAFQRRSPSEENLSINRLQYFGLKSIEGAIGCVRDEFLAKEFGLSKNGRFVVFNVGSAKRAIRKGGYNLKFIFDPVPPIYSHSSICDIPHDSLVEREIATALKRLIKISHTFEGLPQQTP